MISAEARDAVERAATRVFGKNDPHYDDAVQEGLIEIWNHQNKQGTSHVSPSLAYTIARRRALQMIQTPTYLTGHKKTRTFASGVQQTSIEAIMAATGVDDYTTALQDTVEHAATCDTATDVRAAVGMLEPTARDYVFQRFWVDPDERGMEDHTGQDRVTNRRKWAKKYKPALTEALQTRGVTYAY